ncbi:hypothetical protein ACOJBM_02510 [Rhizobium beringeri]
MDELGASLGSLGRVDHEGEETSLDFEVAEDGVLSSIVTPAISASGVTGSSGTRGRSLPEPVPELRIFLAQVIYSGETIGDVFLSDAGFEGEAHLMKHYVVPIAVANERLIVAE